MLFGDASGELKRDIVDHASHTWVGILYVKYVIIV
jgi:hypothetical protein